MNSSESDIKNNTLDKLLHPNPNVDLNCPVIEWMGEDLTQCPGVGEWKCKLQDYKYGDLLHGGGNENTDYYACDCKNHNSCPIYQNHIKNGAVFKK